MENEVETLKNSIEELKSLLKAISLSKRGPFHQLNERIKEGFRSSDKATTAIIELRKGKDTKEIADKLDVGPRAVRDKLNRMNEIAGDFFDSPLTRGIPRKGHVLTEIGKFYAEYLLKNHPNEEKKQKLLSS